MKIDSLLSSLKESLESSEQIETWISLLDQLSEAKELSTMTEEQAQTLLVYRLPQAVTRCLEHPKPMIEAVARWLKRLHPYLHLLPPISRCLPWTPIRRDLQKHSYYLDAIQLYEWGVEAKLETDNWQFTQLALLTNITQQPDCPVPVLEKLTTLILELCKRHITWFYENPETTIRYWIIPPNKCVVKEASEQQPIPWSQIVYRCSPIWQYQQSLEWISLLQAGWQHNANRVFLAALQDFWQRSYPLAQSLRREAECWQLRQADLIRQLGTLWSDEKKINSAEMKWEDRWDYNQQLLKRWFSLLQLNWPTDWSTYKTKTKDHINQQWEITKTEWHYCLKKLREKADVKKIAKLLQYRQLLLQSIERTDERSRPIWAQRLKIEILESDETQLFIHQQSTSELKTSPDLEWLILKDSNQPVQKLVAFALAILGPAPVPLQVCLTGSMMTGLACSASDLDFEILIQQDSIDIRHYLDNLHQLMQCFALPLNRQIDGHAAHTPWQLAITTWRDSAIPDKAKNELNQSQPHARWHLHPLCATLGGDSLLTCCEDYRRQLWADPENLATTIMEQSTTESSSAKLLFKPELKNQIIYLRKNESDRLFHQLAQRIFNLPNANALHTQFTDIIKALTVYADVEAITLLETLLFDLLIAGELSIEDEKSSIKQTITDYRQALTEFKKYNINFSAVETAFNLDELKGLDAFIDQWQQHITRLQRFFSQVSMDEEQISKLVLTMHDACKYKKKILEHLQKNRHQWHNRLLKLQYPNERFEKIFKVFLQLFARQHDISLRFWQLESKDKLLFIDQEGPINETKKIDILLEKKTGQCLLKIPIQEVKFLDQKSNGYQATYTQRRWQYYLQHVNQPPIKISTERFLAITYLSVWIENWEKTEQQEQLLKAGINLKDIFFGPLVRLIKTITILGRLDLTNVPPYSAQTFTQLDFLVEKRFLAEPFSAILKATLHELRILRERVHQLWLTQPFHPLLTPERCDTVFRPNYLPDGYPKTAMLSEAEWQWLQQINRLLFTPLHDHLVTAWQTLYLPQDWDPIRIYLEKNPDDTKIIDALAYCLPYSQLKPSYYDHYNHVMSEKQQLQFKLMIDQLAIKMTVASYPTRSQGLRPPETWKHYEAAWQQQLLKITLAADEPGTTDLPQLYWYNPINQSTVRRALRPVDAKNLFTGADTPQLNQALRSKLGGVHIVLDLHEEKSQTDLPAAYLKCFPQWPLRQRLASIMDYQLTGDYLPHTQIHLVHPKTGRHYPLLISKARGQSLEKELPPLAKMPKLSSATSAGAYTLPPGLLKLDSHYFALGTLMSIALAFGDASPNNISNDENNFIKRVFVHDADCLFAEAWEQKREWILWQQKRPGLKSMYFAMPQMQDPIPDTAIDVFCRLSILNLLQHTLSLLIEEEAQYQVTGYPLRGVMTQAVSTTQQLQITGGSAVLVIKKNQHYEIGCCEAKTKAYQEIIIDAKQNPTLIFALDKFFEAKSQGYERLIMDTKIRTQVEILLKVNDALIPPLPMQQQASDAQWSRLQVLQLAQGKGFDQKPEDACCLPLFFPKQEIGRLYKHLVDMQTWLREQQALARQQRKNNPNMLDFLFQFTNNQFAMQVAFLLRNKPDMAPHQRFACLNHPDYIKEMEELIRTGHELSTYRSLPTITRPIRTSQIFNFTKDVGQSSSVAMTQASSEAYLQSYHLEEKHQEWQDQLLSAYQTYIGKYTLEIHKQLFDSKADLLKILLEGQLQGSTVEMVLQEIGRDSRRLPHIIQKSLIPALREFRYHFQQLDLSNWSQLKTADLLPIITYSASRLHRLRLVQCHSLDDTVIPLIMQLSLPYLYFLEIGASPKIHQIGSFMQPLNLPVLSQIKFQENPFLLSVHVECSQLTRLNIQNCRSLGIISLDCPQLTHITLQRLPQLISLLFKKMRWDSALALAVEELTTPATIAFEVKEYKYSHSDSTRILPTKPIDIETAIYFRLLKNIADKPTLLHHTWLFAAQQGCFDSLKKIWEYASESSLLASITDTLGNTALHLAAEAGHTDCVDWLLHQGFSSEKPNHLAQTALHKLLISHNKSLTSLACLLKHHANVAALYQGHLPAYLALEHGDIMSLALVESAASAAEDKKDVWHRAYFNNEEEKDSLISFDKTQLDQVRIGLTPLSIAAWRGHSTTVKQLLRQKAEVNLSKRHQITPLPLAAALGNEAIMSMLIEAKAQIDKQDNAKRSAFHYAVSEGHLSTVEQLLSAGANPVLTDLYRRQPLHIAASREQVAVIVELIKVVASSHLQAEDYHGYTPLALAIMAGSFNTVKKLLEVKAELNYKTRSHDEQTALHYAVQHRQFLILHYLLDMKANPHLQDHWGRTALHLAALGGQVEMITVLLQAGARVQASDYQGCRPLHLALNSAQAAYTLIEAKANIYQVDGDDRTPLHHVACHGNITVAEILIRAKADINARSKLNRTPIFAVCNQINSENEHHHLPMIRLLLSYRADIDIKEKVLQTHRHPWGGISLENKLPSKLETLNNLFDEHKRRSRPSVVLQADTKEKKLTDENKQEKISGLFPALFGALCQLKGQDFVKQFPSKKIFCDYLIQQLNLHIDKNITPKKTLRILIHSKAQLIAEINQKIDKYTPLASDLFKRQQPKYLLSYISYLHSEKTTWDSNIELYLISHCCMVNITIKDKKSRLLFSTSSVYTETINLQRAGDNNYYFYSDSTKSSTLAIPK